MPGNDDDIYQKRRKHLDLLFENPEKLIKLSTKEKPNEYQPPEFVQHITGSCAGAGSGEFHIYRNARRKEYERLKRMEEDTQYEISMKEYEEKTVHFQQLDEQKTTKNRLKRQKQKAKLRKQKTVIIDVKDESSQHQTEEKPPLSST
jgi:hypothetical protein